MVLGAPEPDRLPKRIKRLRQKEKAARRDSDGLFAIWLPFVDAFRNELAVPSGDMLGTFVAAQDAVYL
jgi:hypothetical protein